MEGLAQLLPFILIIVVFYFLLIRPQRKRQQEQLRMQSSLAPGTRVMTTAGLYATVVAVDDDDVILEVAPGVESRYVKGAIARVVTPVPGQPEDAEVGGDTTPEVSDTAPAKADDAPAAEPDTAAKPASPQDEGSKSSS
ncbi:preprotein translocase subunit YajC [Bailinhaonella thermotolerans]|uniref:preprotein translocase subunit YajC n=1 Tax=Bailinhaonella thermotolerans TaxID=1070861 RepID=UPI00192A656F|nr:preprotein translocase subunit YajC [Bailinhaonella thermotolerans]